MARLATAGVNSCGVMAINGFHHWKVNEKYKETKQLDNPYEKGSEIRAFISNRIIRTNQRPGQTRSVPFEFLMKTIDNHDYGTTKTIIITINETQSLLGGGYWPKEFERWGFRLVYTFENKNGETNYFYMRTPLEA